MIEFLQCFSVLFRLIFIIYSIIFFRYNFNSIGDFSTKDIDDLTKALKDLDSGFIITGTTDNKKGTATDNINVTYDEPISFRMGFAIGYIF